MQADGRVGSSFKSDEMNVTLEIGKDNNMDIDEVTWGPELGQEEVEEVTWSRSDFGTTRLMLPGSQGPKWISCTRLVSRDLDSGQIIEDRPVSEITERERRMEFRGGRKHQNHIHLSSYPRHPTTSMEM